MGISMEKELRRLLTEFSLNELARMTNQEILSRVEALRELGNAPHYLWRFPAGNATELAEMGKELICAQNGQASFSIHILEEEIRARTGVNG